MHDSNSDVFSLQVGIIERGMFESRGYDAEDKRPYRLEPVAPFPTIY